MKKTLIIIGSIAVLIAILWQIGSRTPEHHEPAV